MTTRTGKPAFIHKGGTMSDASLNEIVIRQYGRSWRMVEEAVAAFAPEEWRTGEVAYLTPARTAYHIVETAEFYSGDTPDGFPWAHRFGFDWEADVAAGELPTQEAILSYLADVRPKVEAWLEAADLMAPDPAFPWTGGTVLDRAHYLVRHTHHHVGEMWAEVKRRGHGLPDWY
jgi:hypothetical protein